MPTLAQLSKVTKDFGLSPLFTDLTLTVSDNDRIAIVGPNGSGKSTTLSLINNTTEPDEGTVVRKRGVKVAYLAQQEKFSSESLIVYMNTYVKSVTFEKHEGELASFLYRAGFQDPESSCDQLSGGWQKRLSILARLVSDADLLLFDEPTNHLDWPGILWLEKEIKNFRGAILLVSHDRYFLQRTTNRTLEINPYLPKGFLITESSFEGHKQNKIDTLHMLAKEKASLKNQLRTELAWLNTQPKARTTKSASRVERVLGMQDQLNELNSLSKAESGEASFSSTGRRMQKLAKFEEVDFGYDNNKPIFNSLNIEIKRGQNYGILGANGVGKSTLLKVIGGELYPPQKKRIFFSDDLQTNYFDQHRITLNENRIVKSELCDAGQQVFYQGRHIHVTSYLNIFGLASNLAEKPIHQLSGGQRARVLLAKIMTKPCDLLLLDEPTNDLDIDTLETLESSLLSFNGSIVMISHDRFTLSKICDSFLAINPKTKKVEHFASVDQWENSFLNPSQNKPKAKTNSTKHSNPSPPKKLSYMEQREYDQMEQKIAKAEEELAIYNRESETPEVASNAELAGQIFERISQSQATLDKLYERWEELEAKVETFKKD